MRGAFLITSSLVCACVFPTPALSEGECYMTIAGDKQLGKIVEDVDGKKQFATCAGNLYPLDQETIPTNDLCPQDPGMFGVVQDVKIDLNQVEVMYESGLVKTWTPSSPEILGKLQVGSNVLVDAKNAQDGVADLYQVSDN